jgi:hypothetical protein
MFRSVFPISPGGRYSRRWSTWTVAGSRKRGEDLVERGALDQGRLESLGGPGTAGWNSAGRQGRRESLEAAEARSGGLTGRRGCPSPKLRRAAKWLICQLCLATISARDHPRYSCPGHL